MDLLVGRKVVSREKRTSAITAYVGNNKMLQDDLDAAEITQRIRTFSQSGRDEIIEALRLLSKIRSVPVIVHGAVGCSAGEICFGKDEEASAWYSTDLDERDTIMGGDERLRKTLIRACGKYRPEIIFIVLTPVVAINNDDVNSVIMELEEELNVKIISVYTDGFKTKAGINGIDIVLHSLSKYVVQDTDREGSEGEDFINLITISENKKGIDEILRLLREIGIPVNVIPQFASVEDIKKAGLAKASIAINDDEADILLTGLNEKAQVLPIRSGIPIGVEGTSRWLKELGRSVGIQDKVAELISKEEIKLEKYGGSQFLSGKKVFIELQTSVAIELAKFIGELGGEVTGIAVSHIDDLNKENLKALPDELTVKVGDGQPFETANMLIKNKPDFYIGGSGNVSWVSKLGILPISVEKKILYGYEGALELIESFKKAEKRRRFTDYLAENTELPYSEAWLKKNANWYIKQEER